MANIANLEYGLAYNRANLRFIELLETGAPLKALAAEYKVNKKYGLCGDLMHLFALKLPNTEHEKILDELIALEKEHIRVEEHNKYEPDLLICSYYDQLGTFYIIKRDMPKAIAALKRAAKHYRNMSATWREEGDIGRAKGDEAMALTAEAKAEKLKTAFENPDPTALERIIKVICDAETVKCNARMKLLRHSFEENLKHT